MEQIWSEIKVLLVPSLWLEAWGIVVVEAQVRGIPVISSDSGAIPEAKLGLSVLVHINSLTGEGTEEGEYIVPEQDVEPWRVALTKLMTDKDRYEELSESWLTKIDDKALESWLSQSTRPKTIRSIGA